MIGSKNSSIALRASVMEPKMLRIDYTYIHTYIKTASQSEYKRIWDKKRAA